MRIDDIPADIVHTAEKLFGGRGRGKAWLHQPNPAFRNRSPRDLISDDWDNGLAHVRQSLEAMERTTQRAS
ncbi:MbcA/ParS/Xre antitoxin family protein [Azospirillum sp. SYSU D00513]|uniref:MbcA/ParS/Xre antitoxin family protein n=1 Tax=Azospirillum sp. SYSU D00513 TaxID=2812561 RepID=UPI001A95FCF4|nr:MbcA/ParS/Xre antitoxin family protein [Azospirillum sp. SYSU D00513]